MATNHDTASSTDGSADVASLKDTIEGLINSIMKTKDNATEKTKAAIDKASVTVREKPIASMIVMFLIGVILGRLFTMLRRA